MGNHCLPWVLEGKAVVQEERVVERVASWRFPVDGAQRIH